MKDKNSKIKEIQNKFKTIEDIWKEKDSRKEKWTITNQEVWLVENGKKVKLMAKNEDTYKEIYSLGKEEIEKQKD